MRIADGGTRSSDEGCEGPEPEQENRMSVRSPNVRQLLVLSLLTLGILAAGSACNNDPNSESCNVESTSCPQ